MIEGFLSVNWTVASSTALTLSRPTRVGNGSLSPCLRSSGSSMRLKVNSTAFAFSGSPFQNFTFGRSLNVQVRWSSPIFHSVASSPTIFMSRSYWRSWSKMALLMLPSTPLSWNCGSSVGGSVPWTTTTGLSSVFGWAAGAAEAGAAVGAGAPAEGGWPGAGAEVATAGGAAAGGAGGGLEQAPRTSASVARRITSREPSQGIRVRYLRIVQPPPRPVGVLPGSAPGGA